MLVPAMQSTGTCKSSSTLITPRCAPPRAPPPPSTRPMRGRTGGSWAWADAGGTTATETTTASAAAATRTGRRRSGRRLGAQRERRELRVAVVVVVLLGALERPHDPVGDRREHDFDAHLAHELGEH